MTAQRHALVWGNMSVASRQRAQARKRTQSFTFSCWMERKYQLQHNKSAKLLSLHHVKSAFMLIFRRKEFTCVVSFL